MSVSESDLRAPANSQRKLSHLRVIQFTGIEARAFLQTQLSSDLHQLNPERPQFTTWCKANGRALTLGWLFDAGASLLWFVPSSNAELVTSQISIYKLRTKVQITLLQDWVIDSGEFKLPDGRSIGFSDAVLEPEDSSNAWILADIMQFWPTLGGNDRFLPQMLGIERLGGLSLKKGCFPGQEVIARVHYKGEVKRTLARYLEIPGEDAGQIAGENHGETSGPFSGTTADFELVQFAIDAENFLNVLAVVKKPAPELIRLELQGQQRTLQRQREVNAPN